MELPITDRQAEKACEWLKHVYGPEMAANVFGPFDVDHLCAIVCQETAYFWLPLLPKLPNEAICGRCVLDATGDTLNTAGDRQAFPKSTVEFRRKYGDAFTDILIDEGNKTRRLRGFRPWKRIYKGYGIFQYDLQFVLEDEKFFRETQWYSFIKCLNNCLEELRVKLEQQEDVWEAIRAYNGRGTAAQGYRDNVKHYYEVSRYGSTVDR